MTVACGTATWSPPISYWLDHRATAKYILSTSIAPAVYPTCRTSCALSIWRAWDGGSGCQTSVCYTVLDVFRPRACCGLCTCMAAGAPGAGTCAGCSSPYARGYACEEKGWTTPI